MTPLQQHPQTRPRPAHHARIQTPAWALVIQARTAWGPAPWDDPPRPFPGPRSREEEAGLIHATRRPSGREPDHAPSREAAPWAQVPSDRWACGADVC